MKEFEDFDKGWLSEGVAETLRDGYSVDVVLTYSVYEYYSSVTYILTKNEDDGKYYLSRFSFCSCDDVSSVNARDILSSRVLLTEEYLESFLAEDHYFIAKEEQLEFLRKLKEELFRTGYWGRKSNKGL
jgi:hypothetical protein